MDGRTELFGGFVHLGRRGRLLPLAGLWLVIAGLLIAGLVGTRTVDRSSPRDTISAAFARTARAGSARVVTTLIAAGGTGDDEASQATVIDGIVGFGPVRGTIRLRAAVPVYAGAPADTTLVLTKDALYTRSDAVPTAVHGGKHWFRSARENGKVPGPFSAVVTAATKDRVAMPDGSGAGAVRRVGTETVSGARVTHYAAALQAAGHPPVQLDVWVDSDGRVRRFHETSQVSPNGRFEMDVQYRDFGVRVPNDTPAADDVVDGSSKPGVIDAA